MRNLYQDGKDRSEFINRYGKSASYFQMCFLNELIVGIIRQYIDNINIEEAYKVDSLSNILVHDRIKLYSMTSINDVHISINDTGEHSITIPYNLEKFEILIIKFLHENNLGTIKDDIVYLNCNLQSLIMGYINFINSKLYKNGIKYEANDILERNNDIIALIHADLFENWFLDKILVGFLSKKIKRNITPNDSNMAFESMYFHEGMLVYKESYVENNHRKIDSNLNMYTIKDEYYDIFLKIVREFMKCYNIGGVLDYSGFFAIEFNDRLDKVLNAYYMEKQRINTLVNNKDNKLSKSL